MWTCGDCFGFVRQRSASDEKQPPGERFRRRWATRLAPLSLAIYSGGPAVPLLLEAQATRLSPRYLRCWFSEFLLFHSPITFHWGESWHASILREPFYCGTQHDYPRDAKLNELKRVQFMFPAQNLRSPPASALLGWSGSIPPWNNTFAERCFIVIIYV